MAKPPQFLLTSFLILVYHIDRKINKQIFASHNLPQIA